MPSRLITLVIIALWLVTTGLFVARDLWPRLAPSEPLMFPVDIVDEAARQTIVANRQELRDDRIAGVDRIAGITTDGVSWYVLKNGGGGYRANTYWDYIPEDDSFRSRCELGIGNRAAEPAKSEGVGPLGLFQFQNVDARSSYYLTRAGHLTRLEASTEYDLFLAQEAIKLAPRVRAEVSGEQRAGSFVPHLDVSFPLPGGKKRLGPVALGPLRPEAFQRNDVPVPAPGRGLVLNPLHPPRRIPNLTPGQRWRVAVIDPFALIGLVAPLWPAGEALPDAGASVLEAAVLPRVKTLVWDEDHGNAAGKTEEVTCRVIECLGDGAVTRLALWAREGDGFLLKQEADVWGDTWTFWRRDHAYRMEPPPPQIETKPTP